MKLNKFWLVLAGSLAISWINETQAQRQFDSKSQDIAQVLKPNETFVRNKEFLPEKIENHEEFIKTNLFELEKIYSRQECLELINKHFLIELNKYRVENWKKPLKIDGRLKIFSQNRAQYLFDNSSLEHGEWTDNLQNRLINFWIECTSWGENLCAWQMTIKKAFDALKNSKDHNKLLLEESIENIWLWIVRKEKWWVLYSTRVMTAIWSNQNN